MMHSVQAVFVRDLFLNMRPLSVNLPTTLTRDAAGGKLIEDDSDIYYRYSMHKET